MHKGTTPTHTYVLDFDTSAIKTVKITYSQAGREVLTKRTQDCTLDGHTISVRLSQEETFLFKGHALATIQLRILTAVGDALTSDPMTVSVGECLDDEVLT